MTYSIDRRIPTGPWARTRAGTATMLAAAATLLLATACGAGDRADTGMDDRAGEEAAATELPAPRILQPTEGEALSGPVQVVLDAENVEIVPAGEARPNSGHHHLFLNAEPVAEGEVIPADIGGVVHLGQAQTQHTFDDLAPGEYTLIAMIGDFAHRVMDQSADTVRFRVVEPSS